MGLKNSLPLVLAVGCAETQDLTNHDGGALMDSGYVEVSDFSEATSVERDAKIEEILKAELMSTYGHCQAVFDARPPLVGSKFPNPPSEGHVLVKSPMSVLYGDSHFGKWDFQEFKDGEWLDEVHVDGACAEFFPKDAVNFGPVYRSSATPHLHFQEALDAEPPHYSWK